MTTPSHPDRPTKHVPTYLQRLVTLWRAQAADPALPAIIRDEADRAAHAADGIAKYIRSSYKQGDEAWNRLLGQWMAAAARRQGPSR